MIYEDTMPGFADLYGVGIDADDSIYVMSAATRILNGKPYPNRWSGTVVKGNPKTTKVLSQGKGTALPLAKERIPNRPADIQSAMQQTAWVENADWFYGGVGFGGKNSGNGCACSNYRFALDYLDRVFAPELDLYSIAVLDSSGNLITRIGRYGNVDDGKPLIAAGGSPGPRSIGGDEVALFHGAYLAADTDHRLYIADPGNDRVLSVKLGYHVSERTAVSGVKTEKSEE